MNFADLIKLSFPVSGVETYLFIPPVVAFCISFFTSMAGVSGAFLILPFQMSVLGFTTPSVSATNFLYNLVGTPGGVIRYVREKRMLWSLAYSIISGTLPGVMVGYYFRVKYLPEPRIFKFFVGMVLLYIGFRLLKGLKQRKFNTHNTDKTKLCVSDTSYTFKNITFSFMGEKICFSVPTIFILSLIVGIIGGIYGIGGGAIIAPFCVSVLHIPVYAVAGAILMANFMTSLTGIFFYSTFSLNDGHTASPDWLLGILFGIGGLLGMYFGAKYQRHIPERIIKLILALVIFTVSGKYIVQFFN